MWMTSQKEPQLRKKAGGTCPEVGQGEKWKVIEGLSPEQLGEWVSLPPLLLVGVLSTWHLSSKLTIWSFFSKETEQLKSRSRIWRMGMALPSKTLILAFEGSQFLTRHPKMMLANWHAPCMYPEVPNRNNAYQTVAWKAFLSACSKPPCPLCLSFLNMNACRKITRHGWKANMKKKEMGQLSR